MKRFKIINADRKRVELCDTIEEVVSWLKTRDMGLESFWVEDIKDDIEISADELLEAWDEGERPEDLQMF